MSATTVHHKLVVIMFCLALCMPATVVPALALEGSISGVVRHQGRGVAGFPVAAYSYADPYAHAVPAGTAITDGNGYYIISPLDAGSYGVLFGSGNPQGYAQQWYQDAASPLAKTWVEVSAGTNTGGIDADLDPASRIQGTVRDTAGVAVANVHVYAYNDVYQAVSEALTDSAGTYVLGTLNSGSYSVFFQPPPTHLSQWFNGRDGYARADRVEITDTGVAVPDIDAVLTRTGRIGGMVTDGVQGLYGILVEAYDYHDPYAYGIPRASALTGTDGSYLLDGLPAGYYVVCFGRNNAFGFAQECFNNSPDRVGAQPVQVAAGQTVRPVNAALGEESSISGRVTDGEGNGIAGVDVYVYAYNDAYQYEDPDLVLSRAVTGAEGWYRAGSLNQGVYKVRFLPPSPWRAEWFNDRDSFAAADELSIAAGQRILQIDAELDSGGAISGQVHDSMGGVAGISVQAYSYTDPYYQSPEAEAVTDENGSYVLRGLDSGSYRVFFSGYDAGHESLWYDNTPDIDAAAEVVVSAPETTPDIDAELSPFIHHVTPYVAFGFGSVEPPGSQEVAHGQSISFTLNPVADFEVNYVTGTCGGSLTGNVYTTDPVIADCSVVVAFRIRTLSVFPWVMQGRGEILPGQTQEVSYGVRQDFVLLPEPHHHVAGVGGTCGGSLYGAIFQTAPVTADCSVEVWFAPNVYRIVAWAATGGGTVSPAGESLVEALETATFTLVPERGFQVDEVSGTCGGVLAGREFITAPVREDCTVEVSFVRYSPWILYIPPITRGGVRQPAPPPASDSPAPR